MSEQKFKTMRHIETVRNFIHCAIRDLIDRAEQHDQSKLQSPEAEIFEEYTPKLRDTTYGSDEYNEYLKEMNVALEHHYKNNRHHPEYHNNGFKDMNLLDILEMLLDWKAATMRHDDGDILKSLDINQKRFGYSDEMKNMLFKTLSYLDMIYDVFGILNHAEES
jgi:hypothetical protein